MNSARNSRTTCRSRNLAIAVDDRSNSRAARAAAAAARLEDRDVEDATDEVDAVVVVAIVCTMLSRPSGKLFSSSHSFALSDSISLSMTLHTRQSHSLPAFGSEPSLLIATTEAVVVTHRLMLGNDSRRFALIFSRARVD